MDPETKEKVQKVFRLMGVENFQDLSRAYTRVDQELMKARAWDDRDPALLTNQVKDILLEIDPEQLPEEDREWRAEIMWFWHHHAISIAIWKHKNQPLAQHYAELALK